MSQQIVKWKPTPAKNFRNEDCLLPFPDFLDSASNWTILERIFQMEPKKPIAFSEAARLAHEKFEEALNARQIGYEPGQCNWYARHFIDWISSLGYHIDLNGDEFELYSSGVPTA